MDELLSGAAIERPHDGTTSREHQKRLLAVLANIIDGVVTIDEAGIIETINPAVERMFGYSLDELVGVNVNILMAEPHRSKHDSYIRRYLDTGTKHVIGIGREVTGRRKDGTIFPIDLAVSEMQFDGRRAFCGILRDLSFRDESERVLQRFKSTLDLTMDCVFMFDPDSLEFFYVNQGAIDHTGYDHQQLMNMTLVRLDAEMDERRFREMLTPLITGEKQMTNFITVHRSKGGKKIPVDVLLQYIDQPEESPRFVAVVRDITERKISEETLKRDVRSLERLHDITANTSLSFDDKVHAILRLGAEIFKLPLAITSRIEGDVYTVKYIVGPDGAPDAGATFDLGGTYCLHTLKADAATSFHHAGKSEIRNHPCYQQFGLEAYIGAPLIVGGARYGTVNFSGPEALDRPFSENEMSLVQLFAHWIGHELSHQHAQQRLTAAEEKNRLILESAGEGIFGLDANGNVTFVNPAAARMLLFHPDELIGRPIHATVSHSNADGSPLPQHKCQMCSTLADGKTHHVGGGVLWRKDGTNFPVDYTSTPILKGDEMVGAVITFRDITRAKQAERELKDAQDRLLATNRQLETLSLLDGLTGIPNRRNFNLSLEREIHTARRETTALSLIMCDIDHFKAYNDEHGHLAGDRCIKEVAQCACTMVRRPRDLTARYGGEEFAVLLPQTRLKDAAMLAEVIRKAVEQLEIANADLGPPGRVTVSLGVATIYPDEHTSAEDLIDPADRALYRAKQGGRNRVELAEQA